MRAGLASSTALHAGLLGFMIFSFASPHPFNVPPAESMPIDIVSDAELSQMMAGKKTAPKVEAPKPVVEKVDTPKPVENLDDKPTDKPEIKAANEPAPPPPPPPEVKPPEPKPPTPPKAEVKPPEPAPTPPKDAESLKQKPPEKKDEPKPEQQAKIPPPPPPMPPKKPPPPKPVVQAPPKDQEERKFDANQIAALLDKRTPQRTWSAGETINNTASLGASRGNSATLSQTELDALRARLMQLWNPPAGASNPEELIVTVRIRLNIDGTLAGPPQVVSSGQSGFYMTARESAVRAVFRGQPFDMLNPSKYDAWKDIEITFDPRELGRG